MPIPAIFNNAKGNQTVIDGTGKLDVGEYELQLFDSRYMIKDEPPKRWSGWLKPSCIPITIILVLIFLVVLLPLLDSRQDLPESMVTFEYHKLWKNCSSPCVFTLVETLPERLLSEGYSRGHQSTFSAWLDLIGQARNTIYIASADFQLLEDDQDGDYEKWEGKQLYEQLKNAGLMENVRVQMVLNEKNHSRELEELMESGAAEIQTMDMESLSRVDSQLLSNMIIVDERHFYLGSAPLHWKSLAQTKELGVIVSNCSCLAHDLKKVFDVYWLLSRGNRTVVPSKWPFWMHTAINRSNPVSLELNQTSSSAYITSSPSSISSKGRSDNLQTILSVIEQANSFVYISTHDYYPVAQLNRNTTVGYWPVVDDALRSAAVNNKVDIRLLTAQNPGAAREKMDFLNSLVALNVSVKLFGDNRTSLGDEIWAGPSQYIVTEDLVYIGTSSWSGNSLLHDASVGIFIDQSIDWDSSAAVPIRQQFRELFLRDWYSKFARPIRLTNVER